MTPLQTLTPDHPIGTPVIVVRDDGTLAATRTRSTVHELYGRAMVKVEDLAGSYLLERVFVDPSAAEVERLKELAYIGVPDFPALTWKSRAADFWAEVERLQDLLRGIPADIIDLCDGELGEEALLIAEDVVATLRKVVPGHRCQQCKGAGWRWLDQPPPGYGKWLERCDHQPKAEGDPTPEKAREP